VLATSIIPSPYIYLSIARSSFFTFWLDKAYSSTQVDGKFAAEFGGFARRFRRDFSLDAKINPGHRLHQDPY
jgi:hypothetical protein